MLSNTTTTVVVVVVVTIPLTKRDILDIIFKKPKSETNYDNLDRKHLDSQCFGCSQKALYIEMVTKNVVLFLYIENRKVIYYPKY